MEDFVAFGLAITRHLRGAWCRLVWLKGEMVKLMLAITSGTIAFIYFSMPNVGIETWLANPSNYGIFFESVAVCTLLFGGVALIVRLRSKLSFTRLQDLDASKVTCKDGETILSLPYGSQAIIYSSAVNEALERGCNPVSYEPNIRFKLHPLVEEMLPDFILKLQEANWDTSDDTKVRLKTDLSAQILGDHSQSIALERTSYFRDRLSNTLANYSVTLHGRRILDLRSEVVKTDGSGHLFSLRESFMSNHLGGSTLLITSDAAIVYQRQGNRTAENQGRLAPAGSGSFDLPKDKSFNHVESFQQYARDQTRRELIEECGLAPGDVVSIHLCGFGRFLYRNGKPEVFCVAFTSKKFTAIEVPLKEWDYQQRKVEMEDYEGPPNARNTAAALAALEQRIQDRKPGFEDPSGPLFWNIVFARRYFEALSDRPADEARFFGRSDPVLGEGLTATHESLR